MAKQISKPPKRESILFFGDGDEAIFGHIGNSTEEGFYIVHFKPTWKMLWVKQIQDSEYDQDRWIKKIYKKDLCFQLSFDPDFPVWIILCDYRGNEDTPMFKFFATHLLNCPHCDKQFFTHIGVESLLLKNRELDKQLRNMRIKMNRILFEGRQKEQHPDEYIEDRFVVAKKVKELGEPIVIQQQGQQEYPEES